MNLKRFLLIALLQISITHIFSQVATASLSWAYEIGSLNNDSQESSCLDASDNLYITGRITGSTDFETGPGITSFSATGNAYLAKYNSAGVYQWAVVLSGENSEGNSIGVDALGNVFVGGSFSGTSTVNFDPGVTNFTLMPIDNDMFVAKYNSSGVFQWAKQIGCVGGNIQSFQAKVSSTGDVHLIGGFSNTLAPMDFNPTGPSYTLSCNGLTSSDVFVAKYNTTGAFQWAFRLGDTNTDNGFGIDLDANGNVYTTGVFRGTIGLDPSSSITNTFTSIGNDDFFIAKYSPTGTLIWGKAIGGSSYDLGYRVKVLPNGDCIVNGLFNSASFDADPNVSSVFTINKVGVTNDWFLGKYNGASGDMIWAKNSGGADDVTAFASDVDAKGDIYVIGTYNAATDFDPSATNYSLTPLTASPSTDVYLAKYNSMGDFIYAGTLGGGLSDNEGHFIHLNSNSEAIITGLFQESIDMDPNVGPTFSISTVGGKDVFVAKYVICTAPETPTLSVSSTTICANKQAVLAVNTGSLNSALNWVWYSGACGSNSIAIGSSVSVSPSITTSYYAKGVGGCVSSASCASAGVSVILLKDITGNVTSNSTSSVQGLVTLFRYESQQGKWDSITSQNISALSQFTISAVNSESYILQVIPADPTMQVTYHPSSPSWMNATIFSHGCLVNSVKDVTVNVLNNPVPGPGIITGKIVEGLGYGQRGFGAVVPGNPIKGVTVKGGRNPGGDIVAQGRTNSAGEFTLSSFPMSNLGEDYFLIVDIPGLDTNGTHRRAIVTGSLQYSDVNFIVDSVKINPTNASVGIQEVHFDNNHIVIYPNPTKGKITVNFELEKAAAINIEVIDMFGKRMLNTKSSKLEVLLTQELDLSHLNKGIYFINIFINQNVTHTKIVLTD